MRTLIALLVVGACTGPVGPEGPPGEDGNAGSAGSAGTPGAPAETFTSGQRIKARTITTVTTTDDGAKLTMKSFGGWFDSMRNEPCSPTLAADGKTRCMPATLSLTGGYYTDAACTIPAVLTFTSDPACSTIPGYVAVPATTTCPQTVGAKIYARGAGVTNYYSKSGTTCIGPSSNPIFTVYPTAGAEISAASFAEMNVVTTTE
jgi:hypothetical protein